MVLGHLEEMVAFGYRKMKLARANQVEEDEEEEEAESPSNQTRKETRKGEA
jgi:hypothetical protein